MPYGLLPTDIVNSFSQAISSDFAVGSVDGYVVINQEIEFQHANLESHLSEASLQLLNNVPGEIVTVDVSGYFSPSLYAIPETIKAYIVYKGYKTCGKSLLHCGCGQPGYTSIDGFGEASIQSNGDNSYSLLDSFDKQTQYLVIYYDVDATLVEPKSLKGILRDMVCCSLGSRLYPSGSDTWNIVKFYCDNASKMLDKLDEGYMPGELKKIKLLNPTGGIRTVKVNRS